MRARQVGGGHRSQRHAVEGGCGSGRSRHRKVFVREKGSSSWTTSAPFARPNSRFPATCKLRLSRCRVSQFDAAARRLTHTNAAPICLASNAVWPLLSRTSSCKSSTRDRSTCPPAISWARGHGALQERARRLCCGALRCICARLEGAWHGMPPPPLQTAAFVRQPPHFPTTSMLLHAAIASS